MAIPISYHLSEKTARRIFAICEHEPSWEELRDALAVLDAEDRDTYREAQARRVMGDDAYELVMAARGASK